ncbi:MAG: response regulator [Alphaproteobacteria bacterium]|nr:response regulator [Alphaproteobacteria bacterium]
MPCTVLIVEDNELNQKLFADVLDARGYDTLRTAEGVAAFDLARAHRPDLIVMDIQLPTVSGLEVIRWLKDAADLAAIPILAVTAFAMRGDAERIYEAGAEAYMPKPVILSAFMDQVEALIGGKARRPDPI